jgi:hypothetical protein
MEPELVAMMDEEDLSSPYQNVLKTNISALKKISLMPILES